MGRKKNSHAVDCRELRDNLTYLFQVVFRWEVSYYRGVSIRLPCVATVSDPLPAVDPGLREPPPPGAPRALASIVDQAWEFIGIVFDKKEGKGEDRAGSLAGFFFSEPHRFSL